MSVFPTELAVNTTQNFSGSTPHLNIFHENISFHTLPPRKTRDGRVLEDIGSLYELYPDCWSVLVDNGYRVCQGLCARYTLLESLEIEFCL